MIHFHGICHRKFDLKYVGWFLEFRKFGFRGLKGQFYVKKANFRGLIAKIGHYSPILASKTNLWAYFYGLYNSNCDLKVCRKDFIAHKVKFQGKGRFDIKKSIFEGNNN